MTDAEAAKAGLEKVTDFVEGKGVDGARASEALSALATADDAAAQANLERERALAAVKVDKADVDLVVQELEVDRAVADRELRVQGGDVVKALRALVNAQSYSVVGRRPEVLNRYAPQQCRGGTKFVRLHAPTVLRDLAFTN